MRLTVLVSVAVENENSEDAVELVVANVDTVEL